jgi:hypothetical protein
MVSKYRLPLQTPEITATAVCGQRVMGGSFQHHVGVYRCYTEHSIPVSCWTTTTSLHADAKWLRASLTVRTRHVGDRGRPKDDSTEGEKTIICLYYTTWNRFRLQKYRNGGQLWAVNVFSYTIHAQTVDNRAPPLLFPSFFPLTVTFPKLSVILRTL